MARSLTCLLLIFELREKTTTASNKHEQGTSLGFFVREIKATKEHYLLFIDFMWSSFRV